MSIISKKIDYLEACVCNMAACFAMWALSMAICDRC